MRALVVRMLVAAATVGAATASVALAQPGLLGEPWRPPSAGVRAVPTRLPPVAEEGVQEIPVADARTAPPSPIGQYEAVDVIDPWRRERAKPAALVRAVSSGEREVAAGQPALEVESQAPGSWARVLREPVPRFSVPAKAVARPSTSWAHPMAEIVNPWRPRRSSWAHVSEVIVDPWSDP